LLWLRPPVARSGRAALPNSENRHGRAQVSLVLGETIRRHSPVLPIGLRASDCDRMLEAFSLASRGGRPSGS
jgi:hypothetical protein